MTLTRGASHFTLLLAALSLLSAAPPVFADVITISGAIIQSPLDTGNPAVNNPSLNGIMDGDAYSFSLNYNGSILFPGTYTNFVPPDPCVGTSPACFRDSAAGAVETSFGSISLTVTSDSNPIYDDLSLLACLTTGSGCSFGDELTANFQILAADLNSAGAPSTGLDQPHPLDLLEDDGITDIHGTIDHYSYTAVPEPSYLAFIGLAAAALALRRRK